MAERCWRNKMHFKCIPSITSARRLSRRILICQTLKIIVYIINTFLNDFIKNFIYILLPISLFIIIRGFVDFSIYELIQKFSSFLKAFYDRRKSDTIAINNDETKVTQKSFEETINEVNETEEKEDKIAEGIHDESVETEEIISDDIIIEEQDLIDESSIDDINNSAYDNYKLPSSNLLNEPIEITNELSEEDLKNQASQLIHALETFNVQGQVIRISPGPVITLFEIEPAEGVRVNKFTTLSDDLARVMQASSIRVIAPIPGSRSVGIELPNQNPQTVYLKTILNSEKYVNSESKLTIAVGKTTTGDAFTFDLGSLPHLLIAGATGAGEIRITCP